MGVFDWKIIATVIILLCIIAVAVSMHPSMSEFADKVFDKLSAFVPATEPERNVSFVLLSDEYVDLRFTNQNINIIINNDNFYAELDSGNITTSNYVSITGTSISGYVTGRDIFFEGEFSRISAEGIAITFKAGSIRANSTFSNLTIENLKLAELNIPSASGTIMFGNSMTTIGFKNVTIISPMASFIFSSNLQTEGVANKITGDGIAIG